MWKVILGATVVAASVGAQPFSNLLLPEARHVSGVVVDQGGRPIAEARIDHSADRQKILQTDLEGKFAFDTKAPSLVIRKVGFRSAFLLNRDATDVRITLQASASRSFPTCSDTRRFDSLEVRLGTFWFPETRGVTVGPQVQDIDNVTSNYYVETTRGRKWIRHGSGSAWSFGIPSDFDVWRSASSEESTFSDASFTIVDARGQYANGNRWRYLGKFGESASYSDVDEATAKILDQVLDGVCLRPY
jgi:hypothetical protein